MDPLVNEARESLEKCIDALKHNFSKLRSGRANPAILNGINCDYYGDQMDINSLCQVSMPEPRQLLVKPYSREDIKTIAAAIAAANIGINPQIEADSIRLVFPPMTEDVRKNVAKDAKKIAEESRVAIRNIRRDFMDLVKSDEEMSEDYQKRVQEDIQKEVDAVNKQVDELLATKTEEILSI